ncbi:MAG: hypothetical protein IT440_13515 [Phycisphaeraceae bacterium]|nr:hypothetical protein [Phycisphaeraceae bacterium]
MDTAPGPPVTHIGKNRHGAYRASGKHPYFDPHFAIRGEADNPPRLSPAMRAAVMMRIAD